jgi:hypothetical protein
MKKTESPPEKKPVEIGRLWEAASNLISSDPDLRDRAIDQLIELDGYQDSPLITYILFTRLAEPDLEIRFHIVRLLGSLLDFESTGPHFTDRALKRVHYELGQLDLIRLVNLLEVSSHYLSSVPDVENILKLYSYAGESLGGIVNDRKYPVDIRQQAIFYCGTLGLMSSKTNLEILIRRVERARESNQRTKIRDNEEQLYAQAVSAIAKIDPGQIQN